MNLINAPEGVKFLSELPEFKDGLPNGILDKGSTGCGMTTIAIESNTPYIIALPLNAAIDNKVEQYDHLFVVRYGVTKSEFDNYIKAGGIKILCTYDSLYKIGKWMPDAYTRFKLLVDEYQDFLRFYGFKKQAYRVAVDEIAKYEHKTLGSATPIPVKYSPEVLAGLPVTTVKWEDADPINVVSRQVSCPTTLAVKLIKKYQDDGGYTFKGIRSNSLNIFVNSIKTIKTIINATNLTPTDCRVICGSDPANTKELGAYIGLRGKGVKDPYLVTFITSAGYNSIDLYGNDTASIALSYGDKKHTLQSTFIDLPQIAGRMRNEENPFYRVLFHYYTTVPYELDSEWFRENERPIIKAKPSKEDREAYREWEITIEKLNQWKQKAKEEVKSRFESKLASDIQSNTVMLNHNTSDSAPQETKDWLKQLIDNGNEAAAFFIYQIKDNEIVFSIDQDYIRYLRFQMEELVLSYVDGKSLRNSYKEARLNATAEEYIKFSEKIKDDAGENFTTAIKRYLNEELDDEAKDDITRAYPDILVFVSKLTPERIRSLDYSKRQLQQEIDRISHRGVSVIQNKIMNAFQEVFYSNSEIKSKLQEIYSNTPGFDDQKAKATDILKYFPESKLSQPRDERGNRDKGYQISFKQVIRSTKSIINSN